MTWTEKVKEFMKWKAEKLHLPELADDWVMEWIEEQDEVELKGWLESVEIKIGFLDDAFVCPFCWVYNNEPCFACPWGKTHGHCDGDSTDNWYGKIMKQNGDNAFVELLGEDNIKNKVQELLEEGNDS